MTNMLASPETSDPTDVIWPATIADRELFSGQILSVCPDGQDLVVTDLLEHIEAPAPDAVGDILPLSPKLKMIRIAAPRMIAGVKGLETARNQLAERVLEDETMGELGFALDPILAFPAKGSVSRRELSSQPRPALVFGADNDSFEEFALEGAEPSILAKISELEAAVATGLGELGADSLHKREGL